MTAAEYRAALARMKLTASGLATILSDLTGKPVSPRTVESWSRRGLPNAAGAGFIALLERQRGADT